MDWRSIISRRVFLADLGRGTLALAVVGIAACAAPSDASEPPRSSTPSSSLVPPATSSTTARPGSSSGGSSDAVTWERVNLGFVSAYVLVRGGEAAVVDTGVSGSEDAIEASLTAVGLGWDAVGHVILTHKHADHAGSISAVLGRAASAVGYAGVEDLGSITASRPLTAVKDGDDVFGLRIVASPGHTLGHVSVFDEAGGILVAGDALGTTGGTLAGSNPSFTEDATAAKATIVKLGKLSFETLLVGHGDPILTGASAQVATLGAAG